MLERVVLDEKIIRRYMTSGISMPRHIARMFGLNTKAHGWIKRSIGKVVYVDEQDLIDAAREVDARTKRCAQRDDHQLSADEERLLEYAAGSRWV